MSMYLFFIENRDVKVLLSPDDPSLNVESSTVSDDKNVCEYAISEYNQVSDRNILAFASAMQFHERDAGYNTQANLEKDYITKVFEKGINKYQ